MWLDPAGGGCGAGSETEEAASWEDQSGLLSLLRAWIDAFQAGCYHDDIVQWKEKTIWLGLQGTN